MIPLLRRDDGLAVAELVVFYGFVILPTVLALFFLPTWWERQSLARLAAQEAARQVALADRWDPGASSAQALVAQMASNHGVARRDIRLQLQGSLRRGGQVTASVSVDVPALALPFITTIGRFQVRASHWEYVDAFRSFSGRDR